MAVFDFVLETSTSTGGGDLALDGAVVGHLAFASRYTPVTDPIYYGVVAVDADGVPTGQWELGLGALTVGGALTRIIVHASSNSDAPVVFAAGTKRVYGAMSVAAVQALIAAAVAAHVVTSDPHGDRAYVDGLVGDLAPATHASQHQHGGADEIAVATPAANAIPKAGASARLAKTWVEQTPASIKPSGAYGLPTRDHVAVGVTTTALSANQLIANPLTSDVDCTIIGATIDVTVQSVTGSAEIAIYESAVGADGAPVLGARVAVLGTVSTATVGVKALSGLSQALAAGKQYAVTVAVNEACTLRTPTVGPTLQRLWTGGAANAWRAVSSLSASSSYPSPTPGPALTVNSIASSVPTTRLFVLLDWTTP